MHPLKLKTHNLKPNSGFTVLEIMIVVVMITAIASLGLTVGYDVYRSGTLSAERDIIVSSMQKARNFAITNVGESDHGIYLEDDKHTIFRGSSYATRDMSYDLEIVNSPRITSSGELEFVFEQLSGDGLMTGTTTITDDRGISRSISINEEGRINW